MNASTLHRAASGVVLGLALFGIVTHVTLWASGTFWPIALPLCALAGWIGAARIDVHPTVGRPAPQWMRLAVLGLVVVVAGILTHGALATPSRHWDGTIAWELKADYLTRAPTIHQDYFAHPDVYAPARDYPLLQPLAVAAGNTLWGHGRVLFPVLYLAMIGLVACAARVRAGERTGLGVAAALAVTPMLVTPTAGSFDSGYADATVAVWVTATAAALLLGDRRLLFASGLALVLTKPEGIVYAALPVAVGWCTGDRSTYRTALVAWCTGGALWFPLHAWLQHAGRIEVSAPPIWLTWLGVGVALWSLEAWLARRTTSRRTRAILGTALVFAAVLGLLVAASVFAGDRSTMGLYLADTMRPLSRLAELPTLAAGFFDRAIVRMRFLMTFVLPIVLGAMLVLRRVRPDESGLGLHVGFGLVTSFGPFLLSPEDDVQHLVRSTMPRVLMHWTGATWLLSAAWLARLAPEDQTESRRG